MNFFRKNVWCVCDSRPPRALRIRRLPEFLPVCGPPSACSAFSHGDAILRFLQLRRFRSQLQRGSHLREVRGDSTLQTVSRTELPSPSGRIASNAGAAHTGRGLMFVRKEAVFTKRGS